ncbi:hypothetical protein [Rhizobium ruizarguesonis]|uniref:hypothetical protein n=1 Tax=Rhizobium ruizarguesonis TaxID=2081791 RepID=UPI00102FF50A|nr:hypothetical protein [Rhizobium ruizarguesonis]TBE06448.1 hypothetical protein ELH12_10765 [Rhizobium ruizarguesonis]
MPNIARCRRPRSFSGIEKVGGGFTGWLANRLPGIPQRSAYQAIEIAKSVNPELFAQCANITPRALAEVAKATPDIQALIAERIEAGEIFTPAKVKELRKEAAREAAEQEADAAEIRMRATRSLDQMRQAQKETVGLSLGSRGSKVKGARVDDKPTLAEAGINKNLANEGRKLGALSDTEFETAVAETRKAVTSAVRSGGS